VRSLPIPIAAFLATITCACLETSGQGGTRAWPSWLRACTIAGTSESALCGKVTVPESAGQNAGRTIGIHVTVVPARRAIAAADPVLLLAGGPGQGAATLARQLAARVGHIRDRFDLLLIDQRGTGQSHGLQCDGGGATADLMGRIFDHAGLAACRDQLSRRADLTKYTTATSAADYEIVFDALAVRRVHVWGVSYGTRLGYEIARRIPDRVRTLTLESVVPVTFNWPSTGARDLDAALNAVIDDCIADTACASAYPDLRRDVDAAFRRLQSRPIDVNVLDPATGAPARVQFSWMDLAYAMRGILYGDGGRLPALFRDAARGNYDGFGQAYVTRARTLDQQIAPGLLFGVYCAEDLPFVDWPAANQAAAGTRIGAYLLEQYRRGCDVWPQGSIPAGFRDPTRVDVPALMFNGRHDPVTPPRTAEEAARDLPRSRRLIWKYGGHGVDATPSATCRNRMVAEFMTTADPSRIDTGCMNEQ
jgi:pimeloyl-ACP methyl ester carboxylesterase